MEKLEEHRLINELAMKSEVLKGRSLKDLDTHLLAQLKGQMFAMEVVKDLGTFLEQREENVQATRSPDLD